jgi:hypothetical protein
MIVCTGFTLMNRLAYIPAFGFDKDIPEETIMRYADESIVRSINPSPEPWHRRNLEKREAGGTHFQLHGW